MINGAEVVDALEDLDQVSKTTSYVDSKRSLLEKLKVSFLQYVSKVQKFKTGVTLSAPTQQGEEDLGKLIQTALVETCKQIIIIDDLREDSSDSG